MSQLRYKRVLLKLSGEAFAGEADGGIDPEIIRSIAEEVAQVYQSGVQVGVVIGGGNIIRGATLSKVGFDRVSADQMGMLATVINALAMQDALEAVGLHARIAAVVATAAACDRSEQRKDPDSRLHPLLLLGA